MACVVLAGWVARTRGRSVVGWVLAAVFLNWMALLALAALPSKKMSQDAGSVAGFDPMTGRPVEQSAPLAPLPPEAAGRQLDLLTPEPPPPQLDPLAPEPPGVRFDSRTGKLLGARYDPVTGERLHSPTTRWFPPPPRRDFVIVQSVWGAFWILVGIAIVSEGELAAAIVGCGVLWAIGASVITTVNFAYRKVRHFS